MPARTRKVAQPSSRRDDRAGEAGAAPRTTAPLDGTAASSPLALAADVGSSCTRGPRGERVCQLLPGRGVPPARPARRVTDAESPACVAKRRSRREPIDTSGRARPPRPSSNSGRRSHSSRRNDAAGQARPVFGRIALHRRGRQQLVVLASTGAPRRAAHGAQASTPSARGSSGRCSDPGRRPKVLEGLSRDAYEGGFIGSLQSCLAVRCPPLLRIIN